MKGFIKKRSRKILGWNIRIRAVKISRIFVKMIILMNDVSATTSEHQGLPASRTLPDGNGFLRERHSFNFSYKWNILPREQYRKIVRTCTLFGTRSRVNVSTRKRACGKRKRRSRNCWKNIEPISNLWLRATVVSLIRMYCSDGVRNTISYKIRGPFARSCTCAEYCERYRNSYLISKCPFFFLKDRKR